MKIGAKITGGFLVVILLMAISGILSSFLLNRISNVSDKLEGVNLPLLEKTYQVSINNGLKVAAARGYVITGNQSFMDDYNKLVEQNKALLDELETKSITEKGKQFTREVRTLEEAYSSIVFAKIVPLRKDGKIEEVQQVMAKELAPAATASRQKMQEYVEFRNQQIGKAFEESQNDIGDAKKTTWISFIVALIIAGATTFTITKMITRPLTDATDHLHLMSEGDFSRDVSNSVLNRSDEFGLMGRAFEEMTKNMRHVLKNIAQSSEHLAASSEELTASAQQSAEAVSNVAQSIQTVASGSEEQVNAVNETSAVVEEISATLEEVAATANEVTALAEKTSDTTSQGRTSVDKAVLQMSSVGREAKEAQKAAEELKDGSQQIGEIVDLISNIAGQTNLLALNAAIEAARAGEAGRGFAVVAEEVRKLAEQSETAASKITELIIKNNASIGNVVSTIDSAIRVVDQGVELVNVAGGNFKEIGEMVDDVTKQVSVISKAIHEAAIGSEHIVTSVQTVEKLSRGAAAETQTVSAATEEQAASMEQIASASQNLAKMAESLQDMIAKFKV
ncbi:methyl-accepting chemotaxis protein [Anaeroarcus burkinensis]|uniref:methyl-accepting chemotaxis protein n=1 Tax=Anaeroarcus burkinensis TaxID=82376 RepID=UPI00041457FF|nr:methyl-accepting chemotaxis protein [Anaeroarcus burkinensis]